MVFHTKLILTSIRKDILFPHHNNSFTYLFRCSCGSSNTGRTNQSQNARIKHVPTKIRHFIGGPMNNLRNTYRYSIAEYLINKCDCVEKFSVDFFSSHSTFPLKVLEIKIHSWNITKWGLFFNFVSLTVPHASFIPWISLVKKNH